MADWLNGAISDQGLVLQNYKVSSASEYDCLVSTMLSSYTYCHHSQKPGNLINHIFLIWNLDACVIKKLNNLKQTLRSCLGGNLMVWPQTKSRHNAPVM